MIHGTATNQCWGSSKNTKCLSEDLKKENKCQELKCHLGSKKELKITNKWKKINVPFSGYPGVIYSGDDFTVASSGLTILETTIGNSNKQLWQYVQVKLAISWQMMTTCPGRGFSVGRCPGHCGKQVGNRWRHLDWDLLQTQQRDVQQPVDGRQQQPLHPRWGEP